VAAPRCERDESQTGSQHGPPVELREADRASMEQPWLISTLRRTRLAIRAIIRASTMEHKWPRIERRLSCVRDRRLTHRGGRRGGDRDKVGPNPDVSCAVCRIGLATIEAVSYEHGQRVTSYRCPVCGHLQHRAAPVAG
jgi:hypothetical protein